MCVAGVCAIVPVGGVAVPADSSKFPHPVGYFPLSGGSTSSWPLRHYSGFQRNVSWIPDSKFGTVAHCKQGVQLLVLPSCAVHVIFFYICISGSLEVYEVCYVLGQMKIH